jgi:predicted secreted protein
MRWYSLVAIYFVLWWLVLFAVLPFGVKSFEEMDDITLGTDRGAPHQPKLMMKMAVTSVIAAILLAIVYATFVVYGFSLKDFIV